MKYIVSLVLSILCTLIVTAQTKIVSGIIKDSHSDEPIPFASVQLKNTTIGKLSDSAGYFSLRLETIAATDSLLISYVG
ncbi:MAG TPA: carboxypeptidase-like regulatory domain-containing protein, partial [Lacibacter sp.]|nr:carboxypeptidase-like regulatory domain-containing protein [Lacibacter sp.]